MSNRISLFELFLIESIIFLMVWLVHHYVASLLSLIIPSIAFAILILSLIFDWIEPSKIPKWYYGYLVVTIVSPICIGLIFLYINEFEVPWLP